MTKGLEKLLFQDKLTKKLDKRWTIPPTEMVSHPQHGPVFLLDGATRKKRHPYPKVGDNTWSMYRIEIEFLPRNKKGFAGLNFHVQDNGDACNLHFPLGGSGRNEAFQTMFCWGKGASWKLYPEAQGYAQFSFDAWTRLVLEVGSDIANLSVGNTRSPILTMTNMPFRNGGIQFWSYFGQVYFRNLKIVDLSSKKVTPYFDNPWISYRRLNILRKWQVALAPHILWEEQTVLSSDANKLNWCDIATDTRGILNLSEYFRDNNIRNVAIAKTNVVSNEACTRKIYFTYTDRLSIWCNSKLVFSGPARGWNDPGKEEHFGGRLIPDEYEVKLRLRKGQNRLVVRTEVTEPFGWGFWVRMDDRI